MKIAKHLGLNKYASETIKHMKFGKFTTLKLNGRKLKCLSFNGIRNGTFHEININNNLLTCVPKFGFLASTLIMLSISRNKLDQCQSEPTNQDVFMRLAVILMDGNHLIMLPRIVFCARRLERLSLANNRFTVLPDLSTSLSLNIINLKGNCVICDNNSAWLQTMASLESCHSDDPSQNGCDSQDLPTATNTIWTTACHCPIATGNYTLASIPAVNRFLHGIFLNV